jgi:type II restriction enzyme
MATSLQVLGERGERAVVERCACPRCKKPRTLRRLPPNFRCADVICDFCGYLAQVKACWVADVSVPPKRILGAAWGVQQARMQAGIFFPLFLVLIAPKGRQAIYYLAADLQPLSMFRPRKPLSARARRANWQGFVYDLTQVPAGALVCLWKSGDKRSAPAATAIRS